MSNNNDKILEFDVLGYSVTFSPEQEENTVAPEKIFDQVRKEANIIRQKSPNLDSGQIAVLVALKLAQENLILREDSKNNFLKLETSVRDILCRVEDLTPSSNS